MSVIRALVRPMVALLTPFALVMLGVRLLLTPGYLQLEYGRPGFPPDEYGFSDAERLRWGTFGITYLMNDSSPRFLGNLRFDTGEPVFTDAEVSHMRDVKAVLATLLRAWYSALALLALLGLWAWRTANWATFRAGLRLGGLLTLAIAGVAAVLGTVGASGSGELFWSFFSRFHQLFFSGDSWLFNYSDTLIRLYPLRFWQDTLLYIGLLVAGMALILAIGLGESARRTGARGPESH